MQRLFLAVLMICALPSSAGALQFTFEGTVNGGTASATMDLEFSTPQQLWTTDIEFTADISNTSPTSLDSGAGANTPGIVEFGFMPTDWADVGWYQLYADYYDGTEMRYGMVGEFTEGLAWGRGGPSAMLAVTGISTGIFNPDALTVESNLPDGFLYYGPTYYFGGVQGEVTLFSDAHYRSVFSLMNYTEDPDSYPWLSLEDLQPYIVMANVGENGEGRITLYGSVAGSSQGVPEPASGLLLLVGVCGLRFACRKVGERRSHA